MKTLDQIVREIYDQAKKKIESGQAYGRKLKGDNEDGESANT